MLPSVIGGTGDAVSIVSGPGAAPLAASATYRRTGANAQFVAVKGEAIVTLFAIELCYSSLPDYRHIHGILSPSR